MTEQHTDKCCYWDDPEFCDCGSREIDRLTSELTSAKEEIERWFKVEMETRLRAGAAEAALASERKETERLREALRYYARLKWFVNDGEYIHKVADAALQSRQREE